MANSVPTTPSTQWPADLADERACLFAGEFFASWMISADDIEALRYRGAGIEVTPLYLRVLLGYDGDTTISDGELLRWFDQAQTMAQGQGEQAYGEFINTYIQPAVTYCSASVCKSLGWTGNNDLAGIGVFSSYYIEASLVTIYMLVLLAHRKFRKGSYQLWIGNSGLSKTILDAFLDTVGDLVLSVFVFSAAVMAASLSSIVAALEGEYTVTTYDIITGMLVSIFSVCPATVLYCLDQEQKAPRLLFRIVLFALWVLMVAVVNLGRTTDPSKQALSAGSIGHPFEVYCQVIGTGPIEAVRIFAIASAGLGALWVLYQVFRKCKSSETGKLWQVVVSILAWIAMWFFLGLFTAMRAIIIEVAGASDKSNEWGFGQIVALATWAPVVFKFLYNLIFPGVKEGTPASNDVESGEGGKSG